MLKHRWKQSVVTDAKSYETRLVCRFGTRPLSSKIREHSSSTCRGWMQSVADGWLFRSPKKNLQDYSGAVSAGHLLPTPHPCTHYRRILLLNRKCCALSRQAIRSPNMKTVFPASWKKNRLRGYARPVVLAPDLTATT